MPKYVALLRGVTPMNPNMRNEKLRGVLEELGFNKVKTVISSGNVLFESHEVDIPKLETVIEAAWSDKLGFTSTTIVRNLDELKDLVAAAPFMSYEHGPATSLNVTFLKNIPSGATHLEGRGFTVVAMSNREVCVVVNTLDSKTPDYMAKAERAFGKQITTRTWKTVERIIKAMET
jgi:uncharacterized protein (DUF1697 family)